MDQARLARHPKNSLYLEGKICCLVVQHRELNVDLYLESKWSTVHSRPLNVKYINNNAGRTFGEILPLQEMCLL